MMNMVVEKLPELAQAFATQLSGIDKINIIDRGGSGVAGGMAKVMATVGGGMTAMFGMQKDPFGIDVAHLMQAKTESLPEASEPEPSRVVANGSSNGSSNGAHAT